jgi:hypothetical protein
MIKLKLSGRFGNQLFYLAFAIWLIDQGNSVAFTRSHISIGQLFRDYRTSCCRLRLSLWYSRLLSIKNNLRRKISLRLPLNAKLIIKRHFNLKVTNDESVSTSKKNEFDYSVIPLDEKEIVSPDGEIKNLIIDKSLNYTIIGNFQHYSIANYSRDKILDLIKKEKVIQIKNKYRKLFSNIDLENAVAIHVRGDDYIGNDEFDIINSQYYKQAISRMKEFIGDPSFYFFFDDYNRFRQLFPVFEYKHFLVSINTKSYLDDFIIMLGFKNFIIPNSTFSWWAAFLSNEDNKRIIRPSRFFKSRDDSLHNINMTEI